MSEEEQPPKRSFILTERGSDYDILQTAILSRASQYKLYMTGIRGDTWKMVASNLRAYTDTAGNIEKLEAEIGYIKSDSSIVSIDSSHISSFESVVD